MGWFQNKGGFDFYGGGGRDDRKYQRYLESLFPFIRDKEILSSVYPFIPLPPLLFPPSISSYFFNLYLSRSQDMRQISFRKKIIFIIFHHSQSVSRSLNTILSQKCMFFYLKKTMNLWIKNASNNHTQNGHTDFLVMIIKLSRVLKLNCFRNHHWKFEIDRIILILLNKRLEIPL